MGSFQIAIFVFFSALVAVIHGRDISELRAKRQAPMTPDDCSMPPMKRFGHECCRLPKERIWGDLRASFGVCFKKMKIPPKMMDDQETRPMRQEMPDGETEMVTVGSTDAMAPTEPAFSSTPRAPGRGRPHWKKLSERVKDFFASMYKEIKNTYNAIWNSVVILTDHHRRYTNDTCFMECVFEDQGFLLNKMINKEALMRRLTNTLGNNEPWFKAAVDALETCYTTVLQVPSTGTCQSGSEEIFRCVFKQIFLNCPSWLMNDYCTSLREFYQKCPNGPPPQISDNHSTVAPEEDMESVPAAETDTEIETTTSME